MLAVLILFTLSLLVIKLSLGQAWSSSRGAPPWSHYTGFHYLQPRPGPSASLTECGRLYNKQQHYINSSFIYIYIGSGIF